MRLSKFPMALIIAAVVSITAITIYLNISVLPVPVVADRNFTGVLVAGSPYLWRASASTIQINSNATLEVTYMPVGYVISVSGPLTNATLGPDAWLIYVKGDQPLLVMNYNGIEVVFPMVDSNINGVTVYVPALFGINDYLTDQELKAIYQVTGYLSAERVVDVETNGTHIIISAAFPQYNSVEDTIYLKLPPASKVVSATYNFAGFGVAKTVNGTTVSMYVSPYEHFVITPLANAQVTITVK